MTGVDLFSGCGGALLGAHRAGVRHLAAVEWSWAECQTLRLAVGDALFGAAHPAWGAAAPGLVRLMDVRQWQPVAVDVWWASPPCQPWSSAGERLGAADPRNGWPWLLALLDQGPAPTWLITENVTGLTHHSTDHVACPGCYWADEIVPAIAERFPVVSVHRLCCADFGVPQERNRVFLVAGPVAIASPAPTHAGRWVSMGEALGIDVGELEPDSSDWWHRASLASGPSRTIGTKGNAAVVLSRPAPCVTATEVKGAAMSATGVRTSRGGLQRASDALQLGTGRRRLTVQECLILQGLPVDWPLCGNVGDQYRMVGNAVPPVMAETLLRQILGAA